MIDTNIFPMKEDLGKNLYRKKTYYTLVIEQEVLAKDKDEADKLFDECGIDHSQINHEITVEKDGVETYMVDANYSDSNDIEYIGKVTIEQDEDEPTYEDVIIDTYASETDVHTKDYQEYTVKEGGQ